MDYINSVQNNKPHVFKEKYRKYDVLIMDDIQFISGKEKVQEELFHTFNSLVDNGAQIVLSSDRPPSEIKQVEKRLLSRFAGGLTVDVESPDFELRTAILLIKAKKYGIGLSIELAKLIAQKSQDARGIEGLLLRVMTQAQSEGKDEITEDVVYSVLSLSKEERPANQHPDEIIDEVCAFYNVKATQLRSAKRDAFLVRPRQVAMFLLKKKLNLTFVEIGNLLGGRDHTTVMHGVDKVEKLLESSQISEDILGIVNLPMGKTAN
jgi:chromosomal replication initiator protein